MSVNPSPAVFVDAHVHLHNCFNQGGFLSVAHANLRMQSQREGIVDWSGMLLLTEPASVHYFREFASQTHNGCLGDWRISRLPEACSLVLHGPGGERLVLVAGRQVVTAERLELLVLGATKEIHDGNPLRKTMREATEAGTIRVLAWGNGKWLGKRGRMVRSLLEEYHGGNLFLGDNSGRLKWAPRPKAFITGQKKGLHVLPGSDPLPFQSEQNKVGSFGFSLAGRADEQYPFKWLHEQLETRPESIRTFGQGESLPQFLRNQVAMQLRKHM